MPPLLREIDELTRGDHSYLEAEDECFYLGEYTARKGFTFSATNNLILNLKKSPNLRGTEQWKWKSMAILQAGRELREVLSERWLRQATLVPIPPSKAKSDPLYDDRILRVLHALSDGIDLDIRELVVQNISMAAAHDSDERPTPRELAENYCIVEHLAVPEPLLFGVFDDLLTTGCHFRAVKSVLLGRFPGARVTGIFIARRVPEAVDWQSMFN